MSCDHCKKQMDFGSEPYVANIGQLAKQNMNFRTAVWTGQHLQMTVMCIPPCEEIGTEVHPDMRHQIIQKEPFILRKKMRRRKLYQIFANPFQIHYTVTKCRDYRSEYDAL